MSITVFPNLTIRVIAPTRASDERITQLLKKRKAWILKQKRFFTDRMPYPSPRRYVSGETHQYLGRQYRLRVRKTSKSMERAVLKNSFIYAYLTSTSDANKTKEVVRAWYETKAKKRFEERFNAQYEQFKEYKGKTPILKMRTMKTRWGSCSKNGTITLNTNLIQAPSHCIDYVIMHELCHLIEHNHSSRYYKLLTQKMPDWKERKKRLEEYITHVD